MEDAPHGGVGASGEHPIYNRVVGPSLTRVEVAALLAVAQDHAFGQPPGAQLRSVVLGQRLAGGAGAGPVERADVWWTSALRFLGCTGHAFESAVVFGDEIDLRSRSLHADSANPVEFVRLMVALAGPGREGPARMRSILAVLATGKKAAEMNFRTACEVADRFAVRLGLDQAVRDALTANFERWNGRGLPNGLKGTAIPRPMRIAQLAQELEVLARLDGIDAALDTIRSRRGRAYDPALTDIVLTQADSWWTEVDAIDPWDAALALAPAGPPLSDDDAQAALVVLADFADLKSPWTSGHSRGVAALALAAAGPLAQASALVHDLGRVAVPNTIWDKPGPLTRDERDRAETHALVTEQLLRRTPYTATLAAVAGAAHERLDGAGYHRRVPGGQLDLAQRVVAAADCYQAMISERPQRPALEPTDAVGELRAMGASGRLDAEAVERVLAAAGHKRSQRPALPAGLSPREADVLRLLALGLTTRQIADRLVITPKTADHHVQHIYTKIGVSTRGAAALFALEHGIR